MFHIILPKALREREHYLLPHLSGGGNRHAKEAPMRQGRGTKTCSLKIWEGNGGSHFLFLQACRWLAPKGNFRSPRRKGKSPEPKGRKSPFLKTACSDTGILCSSKIFKFSKSIKPACVELAQNIKPTGFFLLEIILKV